MDARTPPRRPDESDEVLPFLERLERFLLRVIQGIFVFFFKRIPIWTFQILQGVWEFLLTQCEWAVRRVVKLIRIGILIGVLTAVVLGPGAAIYYWNGPIYGYAIWGVLIAFALLFALQYYARKEYERWKRKHAEARAARLKCGHCETVYPGDKSPAKCSHCGELWVEKLS